MKHIARLIKYIFVISLTLIITGELVNPYMSAIAAVLIFITYFIRDKSN